ncbi:protein phosphatase 1H-like isoform X2 [Pomacea canaliculata]|uniref:protein phosphatase 1H-like isoform X2 n=1 Tax=Pomacea canaliculata TaxID=400727 RepID=UPI000D72645C|nr:protein phosphatase 1H-like isoform X2 [Pomacea canaliculata]
MTYWPFHSFRGDANQDSRRRRAMSAGSDPRTRPLRLAYRRPEFLQQTPAELRASTDTSVRPIVEPKHVNALPLKAGYAECTNAGKSDFNEDQAAAGEIILTSKPVSGQENQPDASIRSSSLRVVYYGLFDGHAGTGAALMAANQLIIHLQEKLVEIKDDVFHYARGGKIPILMPSTVTVDSLVTGALEAAFFAMDQQIERESKLFNISGGCTALLALFFLGKLYVANAGDCRAVIYFGDQVKPVSTEFTPEQEAQRIQYLGFLRPDLLGKNYTYNCFARHLSRKDIGKKVLCRGPMNNGWHFKEITEDDVKPQLITGEGKRARLMGTIGVSRGFGDHSLLAHGDETRIKPFLSCIPEVQVFDLGEHQLTEDDVLVMGSDGLWDMTTSEKIGSLVKKTLATRSLSELDDRIYTRVARAVIQHSRGESVSGGWLQDCGREASFDDISAFVIPLNETYQVSQLKFQGSQELKEAVENE